jgi:hypothetical protein
MTFNVRWRWAGVLALGTLLTGCGDDTPAAPAPSPTPTPTPPTQVLSYQPVWELPRDFFIVEDFAIPGPGEITATVDWQSQNNNVDVVLTKAPCSIEQFFIRKKCPIYDQDTGPNRKPAVATFMAEASHQGPARIWVINKGPGAEKGSFIIEREVPQ